MSVVWQQVDGADDVDAPLQELPAPPRPGWLRRWVWAPALVVSAGLYVLRRTIEDPSGELELWLFMGMLAGLMVTAVAALVRYRDDQRTAAEGRAAQAFAAGARSVTGTVTVNERRTSSGLLLSGVVSYPTDEGVADRAYSHLVRRDEEDELPPPRDGDPVDVWWAPGTETVVVRYHRDWADAVRRRAGGR
ncbi:hypothetical protein [Krasilnikoviella flava]|uniref:Uncharacterized protein n=1 Tax=Krasilnikoviella flava TaxID=526729 RepID=A0A1T5JNP2_9MICO|nr:hypothetical protein [Krasilnikoviella flava]SKC52974.1 hypothetical protein SAMN04324258_1590 [Krasilnikoviella flava]